MKEIEKNKENKKHVVPALLSFFIPGLGQAVKGDFLKGILIFFGMGISYFLMLILVGFIILPILFIWNIYDAYNSN